MVEGFLALSFLVALVFGGSELLGAWGENLGPGRVARFAVLTATLVSGLVVYSLINARLQTDRVGTWGLIRRAGAVTGTVVVIVAMAALSLGSVYNSPRTFRTNEQVTRRALVGTEWLAESSIPGGLVAIPNLSGLRTLQNFLYGTQTGRDLKIGIARAKVPSGFGYEEYDSIAEALNPDGEIRQDTYVAILARQKLWPLAFPENVRPHVPHWDADDLSELGQDPTAGRVYSNGEFEVWEVSYGQ